MITLELTQYEAIVVRLALEADALARERRGLISSAGEERGLAERIELLVETAAKRPWSVSEPEAGGRSPLSNVSEPLGS